MAQGYAGLSTDSIPFHYLANDPHKSERIPAQHASWSELKQLLDVVRNHDRVWQCTPDAANRAKTFLRFFLTSGTLFGKPLKTSALTAVDLTHERNTYKLFPLIANVLNSRLVNGRFHFQVLGTPFRMFAEGAICPIFEEFESSRRLMSLEIEDAAGRQREMDTADFGALFVREWHDSGAVSTFNRDLDTLHIERAPVPEWCGETFGAVRRRLLQFQAGDRSASRSVTESDAFDSFPSPLRKEGEFLLHLFRRYDRDLRWWFTVANDRPEILRDLLFHKHLLPGFNDSGAHLINLAFFDGNLLTLQVAARESLAMVAKAVHRLTREPAEFFGVDAGRLDVGAQADVVLIDPDALRTYDTDANRRMVYRDIFEHEQLVNRSDGVVTAVFIAGEQVWDGAHFTPALGQQASRSRVAGRLKQRPAGTCRGRDRRVGTSWPPQGLTRSVNRTGELCDSRRSSLERERGDGVSAEAASLQCRLAPALEPRRSTWGGQEVPTRRSLPYPLLADPLLQSAPTARASRSCASPASSVASSRFVSACTRSVSASSS